MFAIVAQLVVVPLAAARKALGQYDQVTAEVAPGRAPYDPRGTLDVPLLLKGLKVGPLRLDACCVV